MYQSQCCFTATLLLLTIRHAVAALNGCAMGTFDQKSQWIGQNGILKFPANQYERDLKDNSEMHFYDPEEFKDDYLMLHSCPDSEESNSTESSSGCSHCLSTQVYSCYGMNISNVTLPNTLQRVPLSVFRMNFVNLTTLYSGTFDDIDTRHMKIQYGGITRIQGDAFEGAVNLNTLSVTRNDIGHLGRLAEVFDGLNNLTALYLDHNKIKAWSTEGCTADRDPLLPSLEMLSLSGNPLDNLNSTSFAWLRGSVLRYLNLRESKLYVRYPDVLAPVRDTLEYLDLGGALTGTRSLGQLLFSLRHPIHIRKTRLLGLGLSNLNLGFIPATEILYVADNLMYLSLHGNNFEKLGAYVATTQSYQPIDRVTALPPLPKLVELDMQDCHLTTIKAGAFDTVPNLQMLNLARNSLSTFESSCFRGLAHLRYLDVRLNRQEPFSPPLFGYIFEPASMHFEDLPSLEVLDFSESKIGHLRANAFEGLGSNLRNLSLCKVGIETTEIGLFSNLTGLVFLDVAGNVNLATKSSPELFKGLGNLRYLHMSDCNIDFKRPIYGYSSLADDFFHNLPGLRVLNLTDNNIKFLSDTAFKSLKNIESIDLADNRVLSWTTAAFESNKKLRHLNLNRNRISFMTPTMLQEFSALETLDIGDNPYLCDASYIMIFLNLASNHENTTAADAVRSWSLLSLVQGYGLTANLTRTREVLDSVVIGERVADDVADFLRENLDYDGAVTDLLDERQIQMIKSLRYSKVTGLKNHTLHVIGLDTAPHLYTCFCSQDARYVSFVNMNDTYCEMKGSATLPDSDFVDIAMYVAITFLITLAVGLASFYVYRKRLRIRYFALQIKNATIMSFMGRAEDDVDIFVYDTFISYSDIDRDWVLDNLIPNLEKNNELKVCLHERDFQVGLSILENIIASMDHSRCILLVVSMSFVKSQWCQFELHLAQHRLLETRREELVLVLLEEIPKSKRPKMLQFLMLTKTYLLWPGDGSDAEAKRVFWKRLRKAVNPVGTCSVSTA